MKKRFLFALFALAGSLCACTANLGVFEKSDGYQSYYDALGDVKCLYDGGSDTYDVTDSLFNEDTVQNFSWKDESDAVAEREYLYIILSFKEALKIQSLSLCVVTPSDATLRLSAFYLESSFSAPEKIRYRTSPVTETIYDDDGNPIGEQPIVYDDPPVAYSVLLGQTGTMKLEANKWLSFVLGDFQQRAQADQCLHVVEDSLLYLRIENNSGFNVDTLDPISFRFTNLMIRAIS